MGAMRVAVIATVYNEHHTIERLLDSLAGQTRRPDEVVICDGGSRDDTPRFDRALCAPASGTFAQPTGSGGSRRQHQSRRNLAIAATTAELIAVTDAGVRLEPNWLAEIVAPWERDPTHLAVAGFLRPMWWASSRPPWPPPCCPWSMRSIPPGFCPVADRLHFKRAPGHAPGVTRSGWTIVRT
ncbi:MAG: glycosyltransferase family 2 protein [Anaerolineales bacterium]|nr:glycosyltransferase family 2 protein [Anaerolineales bacterium]